MMLKIDLDKNLLVFFIKSYIQGNEKRKLKKYKTGKIHKFFLERKR